MTSHIQPASIATQISTSPKSGADVVLALLPTLVFLTTNAWGGLVPAMVAATLVSAGSIVRRKHQGAGVGLLLPVSLAYVVLRGVVGAVTGSTILYFGSGLVLSAALAVIVGATAFTRTPAANHLIPAVATYRHLTPEHPVYRRISAHVTGAWAVAELTVTGWEAWHLSTASAAGFVLTRTVVAWPVMAGVIFSLIFYVRARLDPREFHLARTSAIG